MIAHPTALRLDEDGYAWSTPAGEPMFIARGDTAGLRAISQELRVQKQLALHVPEAATLRLVLPHAPRTMLETRSILRKASPVQLSELAWSRPRPSEGTGSSITVVRRAWLDPRVDEVEKALGIIARVVAEPYGDVLLYRSPSQRRRNAITGVIVVGSLAVTAGALVVAPTQAVSPAPDMPLAARGVTPSDPGVARTILTVAQAVPPGANLVAMSADGGATSAEFVVPDPDALRATLVAGPAQRGWRETTQAVEPSGGYRVTYRATDPAQPATTRTAPILLAGTRKQAADKFRTLINAEAARRVVQLRLGGDAGGGTAPLRFRFEITGPQTAVLDLAQRVESGLPAARIVDWRLQPDRLGVRLTGAFVVPWGRTP